MKVVSILARLKAGIARWNHSFTEITPALFEKLFFFGGLASIAYGMGLVYKPLGFIVGGLICFWLATLISGERHAR